jgi:hypothetical protein
MLEKLLGAGFFGCFIGHLVHLQTTLLASLDGLNLFFVVWTITFTFLGCWGLIVSRWVITLFFWM